MNATFLAMLLMLLGAAAIVIAYLTRAWRREYRVGAVCASVLLQNGAYTVLQVFGFSRPISANLSFAFAAGCLVVALGILMSFAVPPITGTVKK